MYVAPARDKLPLRPFAEVCIYVRGRRIPAAVAVLPATAAAVLAVIVTAAAAIDNHAAGPPAAKAASAVLQLA